MIKSHDRKQSQSILVTGSSGLVSSHFLSIFAHKYQFEKLDVSNSLNPVDITKIADLNRAVSQSKAKYLVHFAAFTDVSRAHLENNDKSGLVYQVNVLGTQNVAKVCQEHNIHLIHISTAYIFDGRKPQQYLENDNPNPIEWYGQTKFLAEQAVMSTPNLSWSILRIDQPFGSLRHDKLDVLHKIINQLKSNSLPPQFTNHTFGPTFINDFVRVIDWVIATKSTGIFHASSGESWTDYQFASAINSALNLPTVIEKGDLNLYLKTANRPYQKNTALDCTKIKSKLDFILTPIPEAIKLCTR